MNILNFDFKKSVEDALVGYYISTVSGKFIYANKQLLKIFGYDSLEELKQVYIPEDIYANKEERENFLNLLKKYGKVDTLKIKVKKKDGKIIELILSGRLFDNNTKLEGWIFDITEHEKLKKKLYLFTRIIEENSDAIFITDKDGKIIYKNEKFYEIIGNIPEGAKAKDILPVSKYTENAVKTIVEDIKKHKHWIGELDIINDREELIPCAVKIFGLFDKNDNLEHYISVFRDIRDKKDLETQLKQAQKMELIGLMTGSIIHDINNILTGIGYNVELSKLVKDKNPEKLEKYLDSIDDLISKANGLLQKMLNFTRKSKISKETVTLSSCLQDALSIVSPVIKKSPNIELKTNIKCKNEKILANRSSIVQALLNLIINAIDAINSSSKIERGIITIECERVFIREKSFIRIVVRDNGVGIPEELKERIFEPFFTSKTSETDHVKKGTGLGLSIVMREIKELGGSIDVISEVDKYTEFIILIPEYQFKENILISNNNINKERNEKLSIAILDDDIYFKNSLSEILNFYGFNVYSFDKTEEFYDNLKNINPDLIILDFVLDENRNAKDILDFLYKNNLIFPVFVITGYIDSTVLSLKKYSCVKNILEKPITGSELIHKINSFLKS